MTARRRGRGDDEEATVEIRGPVGAADQRHAPTAGERFHRLGDVRGDDRHARADVEQPLDLLERDRARPDDEHVPAREVEAGHVVALLRCRLRVGPASGLADGVGADDRRVAHHASTLATRAPWRSSLIVSCGPSVDDRERERARPDGRQRQPVERPSRERGEGLVDRRRARCQLRPGRQLAERTERGLLAARPVQGADAPGLEREGEQAVELVRLTALDRVPAGEHDEKVVEEVAVVALVEDVAHGLDLGACDLELVVLQQRRASCVRLLAQDRVELVLEPARLDRAVHSALLRRAGLPPPTPRARRLAGRDRARAGAAADRRVPLRVEGVGGHVVVAEVLPDLVVRPLRERVELDDGVVVVVDLDLADVRP